MPSFLFYFLAAVVIISSLVMITRRNPLPAATALVVAFLALAGLFAMLSAPLLAIIQVLVYAGAIMALVVFVLMLLNVQEEHLPAEPGLYIQTGVALLVMTPVFVVLTMAIRRLPVSGMGPEVASDFGSIEAVGKHLFLAYGFPFELVSLLLTVAVVGVVVLAKRRI